MTPADIDSAAERAHTEAIRDHAARLIDGSEAYPFDRDDYCAVIELCDDHDAALDLIETLKAQRDRLRETIRGYEEDCAALPEDIGVTEYVHAMTEERRRLSETCVLYGGDVAVLSRELADACEALELTDDIDGDRFRVAVQARAVVAERDRLARILAVERGDESAAPEGWRCVGLPVWSGPDGSEVSGVLGAYDWVARHDDLPFGARGTAPTALEAMEAADAARGGDDG